MRRTLGAEHPHTLVSMSNLARCLEGMGLLKDAEPLYRRALEASERTLGAEHPDTLVLPKTWQVAQGPAVSFCSCVSMFRRSSPSIDTEWFAMSQFFDPGKVSPQKGAILQSTFTSPVS